MSDASAFANEVPAGGGLATLDAYGHLAAEYDWPSHETTRALELASSRAWREVAISGQAPLSILELGAGTGALTRELVSSYPQGNFVVTDPIERMLMTARDRVIAQESPRIEWRVEDATRALQTGDYSVIAAGLADPYLNNLVLQQIAEALHDGGYVFLTVPSRRWAVRERYLRLDLPVDLTRFILDDGRTVFARSFAYDASELVAMTREAGIRTVRAGTACGDAVRGRPLAEVAWILGRRDRLRIKDS